MAIPPNASEEEIDRIVRATTFGDFGPTMNGERVHPRSAAKAPGKAA